MILNSLASATLKPLVLSLLRDGPRYGFQLVYSARRLYNDRVPWSNSKLYPILHRMEHDGWIESFWKASPDGPDRKYYRITDRGLAALATIQGEWKTMNAIWQDLWGPEIAPG